MAKMGPKMVALCAAAVGIIYSAGYAVTETPALAQDSPASIASTQTIPNVATAKPSTPVPQNTAKNQASQAPATQNTSDNQATKSSTSSNQNGASNQTKAAPSTQHTPDVSAAKATTSQTQTPAGNQTDSASPAATAQSKYRNGTYYGQGSNRIGTVQVAVTINQGKIVSCEIVNCWTHYSPSYINPVLPNEVVAQQSANIDIVSGATRSSQDFEAAVQQALGQAQV